MLTVNTTAAVPGAPITVTLGGGTGNSRDWLAFARRVRRQPPSCGVGHTSAGRHHSELDSDGAGSVQVVQNYRTFLYDSSTINTRSPSITIAP